MRRVLRIPLHITNQFIHIEIQKRILENEMSKININLTSGNNLLRETIVIDNASLEDHSSFVNLFNKQYNRKTKSSYFFWQFFESILPTRLLVARRNNAVVGFIGIQIKALNNNEKCGVIVDMLIDEPYRGIGIFDKLAKEIEKYAMSHNVVALVSFTNSIGMKALTRLPNWKNIGKVFTLQSVTGLSIDDNVESDKYTNKIQSNNLISFFKNEEYRQWRYDRNPNYSYTKISLKQDYFAIIKIFSDPITGQCFGDIVDFEGDMTDSKILKKLFTKASSQLKEQGIENITTWALPHTPLITIIRELGFKQTQQERYFCLKVLNKKYEYLSDFFRWHLVQADAEIF